MRRSARSAKPKHFIQETEGSDLSGAGDSEDGFDELSNSGDEWQPEKKKKKGKRGREEVQESDSDEDDVLVIEEEDDEDDELVVSARRKAVPLMKKSKTSKGNGSTLKAKAAVTPSQPRPSTTYVVTDEDILAAQAAIEEEEKEERQEQEAAAKEAAEMWDQVRKRKQGQSEPDPIQATQGAKVAAAAEGGGPSLASWLGIPEPDWPTTCADAMINDRDSLFVGFVYSLSTPSLSTISQLLSHLGKTVHPKVIPTNRLPPAMQHLGTNRRGATHDMHAWRCLALKRGRSGLNGPEDFGLEEGLEDDGERYGAKAIEKVIKQLGATDVLVVVSRWYGGTMLGPVRFQHIENCARAALGQHMINEAIIPLKKQLRDLDEELSSLRSQLNVSATFVKPQYDGLDLEKVERLIGARQKAIEMLQKRLATSQVQQTISKVSQAPTVPAPAASAKTPIELAKVVEDEDDGDLTGWDALE
jgi:hypothetical protein